MVDAADTKPTVFVIDADRAIQTSVGHLASTMDLPCEAYDSGRDFLDTYTSSRSGCVILEVRIPGVTGLDIQDALAGHAPSPPVVFLTAHGTISIAVRAMRAGAVHFLEKPVRESELWEAIRDSLYVDRLRRRRWQQQRRLAEVMDKLTPSEQRILNMIAQGMSKKAIAQAMEACIRTVETHQARLRDKLGLESSIQLVHFAVTSSGAMSPSWPEDSAGRETSVLPYQAARVARLAESVELERADRRLG